MVTTDKRHPVAPRNFAPTPRRAYTGVVLDENKIIYSLKLEALVNVSFNLHNRFITKTSNVVIEGDYRTDGIHYKVVESDPYYRFDTKELLSDATFLQEGMLRFGTIFEEKVNNSIKTLLEEIRITRPTDNKRLHFDGIKVTIVGLVMTTISVDRRDSDIGIDGSHFRLTLKNPNSMQINKCKTFSGFYDNFANKFFEYEEECVSPHLAVIVINPSKEHLSLLRKFKMIHTENTFVGNYEEVLVYVTDYDSNLTRVFTD